MQSPVAERQVAHEMEWNLFALCADESLQFAWKDEHGNFFSEEDGRPLEVLAYVRWNGTIH